MKTWTIAVAGVTILFFAGAKIASADPRPPELGVGAIQLVPVTVPIPQFKPKVPKTQTLDFLRIEIYCGGFYGGSYPAGRTVTVEMLQAGKPAQVIHQRTLPEISSKTGYYFYVAVPGGHFTKTTTVRVRLSPGDAYPGNDIGQRTFYHFNLSQNALLR